jgi:hypothetical protein
VKSSLIVTPALAIFMDKDVILYRLPGVLQDPLQCAALGIAARQGWDLRSETSISAVVPVVVLLFLI